VGRADLLLLLENISHFHGSLIIYNSTLAVNHIAMPQFERDGLIKYNGGQAYYRKRITDEHVTPTPPPPSFTQHQQSA
jgi:hypothetical protein